MHKVIYHIDERDKWGLVLGNVKNMVAYYQSHQEEYQIEVLANSEAVCDYKKGSSIESQIKEYTNIKVIFAACHNAMKAQDIIEKELIENVRVVDAGVVELVLRQEEGYAYIKP